jgi:hypothetical protein
MRAVRWVVAGVAGVAVALAFVAIVDIAAGDEGPSLRADITEHRFDDVRCFVYDRGADISCVAAP